MNEIEIPNGAYRVLSIVKNNLYIDLGEKSIKVKNTLKDDRPQYVYVKEDVDGYKVSSKPFPIIRKETVKKNTNKKK